MMRLVPTGVTHRLTSLRTARTVTDLGALKNNGLEVTEIIVCFEDLFLGNKVNIKRCLCLNRGCNHWMFESATPRHRTVFTLKSLLVSRFYSQFLDDF